MSKSNIIETLGYILKEEMLADMQLGVIPNTLVLENQNPYPGYHGKDLPEESKVPEFVFFATKKKYSTEELVRAAQKIRKYYHKTLDVAKADLNIYNKTIPAIRLRDCKSYENILEIQQCFLSEGIEFAKSKHVETTGLIHVQKPFYIEQIEDGIYKDLDEGNYSYFEIKVHLNWEQFRAITMKIKNSIEDAQYDVALGFLFRRSGIVDIVRVYRENWNIEFMKDLQRRYTNEIRKLLLDEFIE